LNRFTGDGAVCDDADVGDGVVTDVDVSAIGVLRLASVAKCLVYLVLQ
jgi:hypothetical protein